MATQGMVTVMKDGAVLMKVVAGCDGQNARLLARVIGAAKQVPDVRTAYRTALQVGFGDRNCLVVVTPDEVFSMCAEEPGVLYRSTFDQPRFCPRWEHGTADHVRIVEI